MLYFMMFMACEGDKVTATDTASTPTDTAAPPEEEVANVEILGGGVEIHSELIGPDAWAVSDAGVGRLVVSGSQTLLKDIRQAEDDVLEWIEGDINAAAEYDGWLLLSIGENLWVWNDELWASPMQESLSATVNDMRVDYWGDLWMMTDKLQRVSNGEITDVALDGEYVTGLWAIDGLVDDWHVVWMEQGNTMVGIDTNGDIRVQKTWTDIRQIVTDSAGNTWVNDGGNIRFRSSRLDWVTVDFPHLCTNIMGHHSAETLWVRCMDAGVDEDYATTEDNLIVDYMGTAAEGLTPALLPEGEWLQVDPSGRLLIKTEEGIVRLSGNPWIRMLGVPENLDSNALIVMNPSRQFEVESVTVALGNSSDGNPLELGIEPPWEISLSPLDFDEGELNNGALDIDVTITWNDGQTANATTSIQVQDSVSTWDDNIQPLHATNCEVCHGSTAATKLDSKQDWIDNIDNILLQVGMGAMPLGDATLSPDEVDLIQSWKDNGFQ